MTIEAHPARQARQARKAHKKQRKDAKRAKKHVIQLSRQIKSSSAYLYDVMHNLDNACSEWLQKRASMRAAHAAQHAASDALTTSNAVWSMLKKTRNMQKGVRELFTKNELKLASDSEIASFIHMIMSFDNPERSYIENAKRVLQRCKTATLKQCFIHGYVVDQRVKGREYLQLLRECGVRFYIRDRTTIKD